MFHIEPANEQFVLVDTARNGLHSDGTIYYACYEFFPSREAAQTILDKFYPKPGHVWKHGDVFNYKGTIMIYLTPLTGPEVRSISCRCTGDCDVDTHIHDAKFLFNIKEKI